MQFYLQLETCCAGFPRKRVALGVGCEEAAGGNGALRTAGPRCIHDNGVGRPSPLFVWNYEKNGGWGNVRLCSGDQGWGRLAMREQEERPRSVL